MAKLITAVLITILAALSPAAAGDISAGATPGTINYQGRLERDNSPVTGTVHIYFRVFDSPTAANLGTCGTPASNPCLWQSPEITVQAVQGMFTAAIQPPVSVFSAASDKYLEVEIESETLSPRERINSVVYSYIAKKLEDGASVGVSSMTAAYSVYMATSSGNVGIGTTNPGNKLTVNGSVHILAGGLVFPDASFMPSAALGSAGGVSVSTGVLLIADSDSLGNDGNFVFSHPSGELARINYLGNMGIGDFSSTPPSGKLDVDGALYVGNEGIYDRDDTILNVKQDLMVEGGRVIGANSEFVSIGATNNVISLVSGAAERMRIHTNGFLGVGVAAPAVMVHSAADIAADTGVRGGRVSIGDYSTWTDRLNEVRAEDGYHLLLQQTNTYNVGVGTDTPREKLHVRGSVRSDYGVIASSGYFSGSGIAGSNPTLDVRGNLRANTGVGNTVELSSTVIYGSLQVTGLLLGSQGGNPAYLSDNQTFSGKNTFTSLLTASTDVVISPRLGVGMSGFDFGLGAADRYLQVGDNIPAYDSADSNIYIVGGTNADAVLNLYRGGTQAARVETQGANTLGLVTGGTTRALINPSYFTVQNSPFRVLPDGSTPALFVSGGGKVGVGVQVTDAAQPLSVNGSIHILSGSLIFPDGSVMTTSSATAATSVSSLSDALVQAGLGGSGSVIIKSGATDGILVDNTGRVGVGTTLPLSKLNVRGGDLVVGSPFQGAYATNGVEDLLVGGSLVVDGGIVQRSATPVEFAAAIIYGDVHLSTATGARTGIGTSAPGTTLDVNGDAQFGSGATKSTFTATGALNLRTPLTVPSGGTGLSSVAINNLIYTSGANTFSATPISAYGRSLVDDADAATARGTLGLGSIATQNSNSVSVTGGSISGITDLAVADGGTGASTAANARTNLGLAIGTNVQAYDDGLQSISGLTTAADRMIYTTAADTYAVATLTAAGRAILDDASAAVQRTTLGLGTISTQDSNSVSITGGSISGITDLAVADGGTGASTAANARTNLGLAIGSDVQAYNAGLADISALLKTNGNFIVGNGTNWVAESGATARTSLGLGSMATQNSNSVSITGGSISGITDLAVADGGTGASTAADARTNLGLGSIATQNSNSVSITGGSISGITDLAVADGGTGASTQAGARTNLGLGTMATQNTGNTDTFTVVGSTTTSTCYSLSFTNGIYTGKSTVSCP